VRDSEFSAVVNALRAQVASLMKMRVAYGEMYCEKHGIGPTGGYCVKTAEEEVGYNHYWDSKACARMAELFAGSTVLDLGCGLGWYGKCLQEAGKSIEWTGFDGSEGIEKATKGYVKFADLTMPQYFEHKYDWVMSLEVGEHIPVELEDAFLSNLVRHAKKGVLLSWAVEGQGGHHHVNNHNNDYVIERLREKGFNYDAVASQSVRDVAELPWFKNTIMIFRRT
jgi:predicted TPR repeat methyltransferase